VTAPYELCSNGWSLSDFSLGQVIQPHLVTLLEAGGIGQAVVASLHSDVAVIMVDVM
jgi:hypothetical protein